MKCSASSMRHISAPSATPKGTRQGPWGAGGGTLNTVEREAMYNGVEQGCQQG